MPRIRQIQQRYTQGELDPKLIGRNDIDQYYGAAANMQNVFPMSQGGFTRRPGLEYIDGCASGAVKMIEFRYSESDTYLLVVTSGQFDVYKDGAPQVTVSLSEFDSDTKIQYMTWTQGGDTLLLFHEDVPTQKVVRNSDISWTVSAVTWDFVPVYPFTLTTTSPAMTGNPDPDYNDSPGLNDTRPWAGECYFKSGSAQFTVDSVNQYIRAASGYARIVSYISTTKVRINAEIPFSSWYSINSGDWDYLTGFEPVWSSTRGYPRCGTFHNGRLYICGSKSLPTTVWGSKIGEYWNFDKAALLDSDAIERTLDVGQNDKIVAAYSGRALFVLTSGGVVVISGSVTGPLTPTNFIAEKHTGVGMKYGTTVMEHEGAIMYVQSEGASIQELVFDDAQNAFTSGVVSWLSSHLINTPVAVAIRKSTSTDQGTYMLVVNTDGTTCVANILKSQGIASFVPVVIDEDVIACGVDGTDMYFVTDDGVYRYLCRFNFDLTLDYAVEYSTGFPISTATGLDYLDGRAVKIIADGVVQSDTVSGSEVTVDPAAENTLVIGIDYDVLVKDLPVDEKQLGSVIGQKKNVSEVVVELYETQNILINGKSVSFVGDGDNLEENPEYTGTKRMTGFRGWDTTGQIEITQ
ncbi:MAG: hypothetical protein HGA87_05280, partial [Desulfobulbaceae bacterium]|nr:hypothetical protein [Desulfobulbaceae bacterium]